MAKPGPNGPALIATDSGLPRAAKISSLPLSDACRSAMSCAVPAWVSSVSASFSKNSPKSRADSLLHRPVSWTRFATSSTDSMSPRPPTLRSMPLWVACVVLLALVGCAGIEAPMRVASQAERRAYAEAIEQIKLGDALAFNTVWAVEHHFREGRSHCPAPEVLLGALSQVTEQIGLGFGVSLTPFGFTHPARVAEKVATVDILSRGRVQWGTGRSTPMEQTAWLDGSGA